ncbi:SAM-dependent methyltransferase [Nonomuraea sp. NPDC046802]|uniref:SAM-dependent methyltransferase n=1 Tax=Nonomuraea sp. NPDC046802 TaxID=3154919 RepID=UPI0034038A69
MDSRTSITLTGKAHDWAARANLEFVTRGTGAAAELGITQWLNLGCGLPQVGETTLDTARRYHADARVAYVDNDPAVTVSGRALLTVPGVSMSLHADARHVDVVLSHVRGLLDIKKPVGIVATALCHRWPNEDDPGGVLRRYMAAFPAGYLIFSHARDDLLISAYTRPLWQIRSMFLTGLRLLQPGLVEASEWRPADPIPRQVGRPHFVAAVAGFGAYAASPVEEAA